MIELGCITDRTVSVSSAKHLEPLKNGKIPVEILVTSKDPESKTKAFDKCLDVIKGAGVSLQHYFASRSDRYQMDGTLTFMCAETEKSWSTPQRLDVRSFRR